MEDINPLFFFETVLTSEAISEERKKLLQKIAQHIVANKIENINFICTHNSRRSQLAQIWAHVAIEYYTIKNLAIFSSGTETTAFHKNTIKALQSAGFSFKIITFSHKNPIYAIFYNSKDNPIIGFSKTFKDRSILKPFVAITTCGNAEENCPFIPEAKARFHLPYLDPKQFDGLENTENEYQKTSTTIACEMAYLFSKVADL